MTELVNPEIVGMPIVFRKMTFFNTWALGILIVMKLDFCPSRFRVRYCALQVMSLKKVRVNLYRRRPLWVTPPSYAQIPDQGNSWITSVGYRIEPASSENISGNVPSGFGVLRGPSGQG